MSAGSLPEIPSARRLKGRGGRVRSRPRPGLLGRGSWAGAPSAALDDAGGILLAHRVRVVDENLARTVIGRSIDGETFTTLGAIDRTRFDAHSMERPALLRTPNGRWRLHVCMASGDWPRSMHWWIEMLGGRRPIGAPGRRGPCRLPGG